MKGGGGWYEGEGGVLSGVWGVGGGGRGVGWEGDRGGDRTKKGARSERETETRTDRTLLNPKPYTLIPHP